MDIKTVQQWVVSALIFAVGCLPMGALMAFCVSTPLILLGLVPALVTAGFLL